MDRETMTCPGEKRLRATQKVDRVLATAGTRTIDLRRWMVASALGAVLIGPSTGRSEPWELDLVLPVVAVTARDWSDPASQHNAIDLDDASELEDVFMEVQVGDGLAWAEARLGATEWVRADVLNDYGVAWAEYVLELDVEDPQARPQVKSILTFKGGANVLPPSAQASWYVDIGPSDGTRARAVVDGVRILDYLLPGVRRANGVKQSLFSLGLHLSRSGDTRYGAAAIAMNGAVVSSRECHTCSTLSEQGTLNLTHAPGRYLMRVGVVGQGPSVVVGDPVLRPHPDNPDVVITRHAPEGALDRGPFAGTTPEDLAARGFDPQPFIDLGFFDPPEPDPEAPCTNGTPLTDPRLVMKATASPGQSKLRFRGELALLPLPLDPPLDPIARGARVRVEDATGAALLDETLPGGAFDPATSTGWRYDGRKTWRYTRPVSQGIDHLALKRVAGSSNVYRFQVRARLASTPVPSLAQLPLEGTLVIDAPVARNGQCGEARFGLEPPATDCLLSEGTRLVCK